MIITKLTRPSFPFVFMFISSVDVGESYPGAVRVAVFASQRSQDRPAEWLKVHTSINAPAHSLPNKSHTLIGYDVYGWETPSIPFDASRPAIALPPTCAMPIRKIVRISPRRAIRSPTHPFSPLSDDFWSYGMLVSDMNF